LPKEAARFGGFFFTQNQYYEVIFYPSKYQWFTSENIENHSFDIKFQRLKGDITMQFERNFNNAKS
jgi:hypothetical protein